MMLSIVKYGEPILETPATAVTEFGTPRLSKLIDDMFETMYAARGIGLAAPQVNLGIRLAVVDLSCGEDPAQKHVVINPRIVSREGKTSGEEGCLSIPGFREQVNRAKAVRVAARNQYGESVEISGEDLLSRCLQHEIDHLEGVLFINHLSPLKRDLIRRKIRKLVKLGEWA